MPYHTITIGKAQFERFSYRSLPLLCSRRLGVAFLVGFGGLNMFGLKRPLSSDCLERPQSKVSKDDALSLYEATLQKLRDGSGLVSNLKKAASKIECQGSTGRDASGNALMEGLPHISVSNQGEGSCSLRSTQSQGVSCSNCRMILCRQCFLLCNCCTLHFCSRCSICKSNNVVCWECDWEKSNKASS